MLVLRRAFVLVGMTVAIALPAACARSAQRAPSGARGSVESVTTGGVARQCRLHIPLSYQQSQSTALVINLRAQHPLHARRHLIRRHIGVA